MFGGVEPEDCLRPNEKALLVDISENFDVPLVSAGSGAPFFGYSGCAVGSEEAVEAALRREELSVVDTVFELEVPLPLHGSQQLTGRMSWWVKEGSKKMTVEWLCRRISASLEKKDAADPSSLCQGGAGLHNPKNKNKHKKSRAYKYETFEPTYRLLKPENRLSSLSGSVLGLSLPPPFSRGFPPSMLVVLVRSKTLKDC
jgi:hypothetical protein